MLLSVTSIPLALYIHIPWCVRKCPYCDFNSHELNINQDQAGLYRNYVDALLADASAQACWVQNRQITSVFIGGGTPSLLPIEEYRRLFMGLRERLPIHQDCEVTMEANPGTLEHAPFAQYLEVGINRLSIGVQSFDASHLKKLGRIHDPKQAQRAIAQARVAGFDRVNVDIMHGLPSQSGSQALSDIDQAYEAGATHLSWYQLTVEPNTVFYRNTPLLPDEEELAYIEQAGHARLRELGYRQYEVSAWAGDHDQPCRHNVNYWQFGDYLAIGAGAHGKISFDREYQLTQAHSMTALTVDKTSRYSSGSTSNIGFEDTGSLQIARFSKSRLPKDYLDRSKWLTLEADAAATGRQLRYPKMVGTETIAQDQLPAEFMLNALRLNQGVSWQMFLERTGLRPAAILPQMRQLIRQGLLVDDPKRLVTTKKGRRYLNQVLFAFIS